MSGMNPKKITALLKMLGIKQDVLALQLEAEAIKKLKEQEEEAGSKLMALAIPDESGESLVFCLYKQGGEEGTDLQLWREYRMGDLMNLLNGIAND